MQSILGEKAVTVYMNDDTLMKVYLDHNGEMNFIGKIDLGSFGVSDGIYLGCCEDFLDPEYDEYRRYPALETLLPKG